MANRKGGFGKFGSLTRFSPQLAAAETAQETSNMAELLALQVTEQRRTNQLLESLLEELREARQS